MLAYYKIDVYDDKKENGLQNLQSVSITQKDILLARRNDRNIRAKKIKGVFVTLTKYA